MTNQFRADLWDAIGAEDEQDPNKPEPIYNALEFKGLPADQVPPGMSDLWERLGSEDPEPGELADPSASPMDYKPEPLVDWDGRKVSVRKIKETAEKFNTTPEAIYRMGTGVGKFEARFNQTILGQTLGAIESGMSLGAEGVVSQLGQSGVAKMFGIDGDQMSRNIHEGRRQRRAFSKLIDADTDMSAIIGPKGAEIYNDAVEAIALMGTAAYLGRATGGAGAAGAVGAAAAPSTTGALMMYSALGVSSWDQSLEEARVQGKSGTDQVKYATAMTGIELGITAAFGRIAKYVGGGSPEELLTPGVIHAARTAAGRAKQAAIGIMGEVDEEALVNATQQGVQMLFGMRDKFDPAEMVQAGVTGAVAGGMSHGLSRLMDSNSPYAQDLVRGAIAAESAVENAYKPAPEQTPRLFPMDDPRQRMLFDDAPVESETGLGPLPDVEIGTVQQSLPPTQQGLFDPVATSPAEAAPVELSRRDQMAAAMSRSQQAGPAGRGAREAKSFAEQANPDTLEKLRQPVNAKEFAALTGIKKTSAAFRESFRDVLNLYLGSPRGTAQDAAGAEGGVGQPDGTGTTPGVTQEPTPGITQEDSPKPLFDLQQELFSPPDSDAQADTEAPFVPSNPDAKTGFWTMSVGAIEKVGEGLSAKQFEDLTGLRGTTPEFRDSFRDTVRLYKAREKADADAEEAADEAAKAVPAPVETPPPASEETKADVSPTPDPSDVFVLDDAFAALEVDSGGWNFQTLKAVRDAIPQWDKSTFDEKIRALRLSGHYYLTGAQNRTDITPAIREAGIKEAGANLMYIAKNLNQSSRPPRPETPPAKATPAPVEAPRPAAKATPTPVKDTGPTDQELRAALRKTARAYREMNKAQQAAQVPQEAPPVAPPPLTRDEVSKVMFDPQTVFTFVVDESDIRVPRVDQLPVDIPQLSQRGLFPPQEELFDKSVSRDLPFQQVPPADAPAGTPSFTQKGLFNPQQELFANREVEAVGTPQPGVAADPTATPPSDTPQTGDAGALSMPDPAKVASLRLDWLSTKKRLGEWYRRNLEMKRGLNKYTFDANEERIGALAADVRDTELLIKDLRRVVKAEYDGVMPREAIDKRLKGEYAPMHPETAAAVSKMRAHMDNLSRQFRELGILDPDSQLYLTVEENEGTYMYRAYARNEDINWASKVKRMPDILRAARAELSQMYPQDSEAKIEWRINQIIDPAFAEASPDGEVPSGEFLGNLKARKDIPEAIRNLMGEYKDGIENFLQTTARLSVLVNQAKFSRDVISDGLKNGYLIADPVDQPGLADMWSKIDGNKVPALKLFHGLYATPETKARLEDVFSGAQSHEAYKMLVAASGWSKFAQTALNPATYMANYFGGYFFQLTSGDLLTKGVTKRLKHAHTMAAADVLARGDDATRAYLNKMYRLGLIGNEVAMKDIKNQVEASTTFNNFMETDNIDPKAVTRAYGKLYQGQDTIHKIAAFESKKEQYARAYPDATLSEIEKLAAEDVKQHQPTWTRVSRGAQSVSRSPFIADYFSFLAETVRTTKNAIVNGFKEVQSDNPEIKKMGQRRLIGLGLAPFVTPTVAMISKAIMGITDEEEEALRKFVAPWSRDSDLVYFGKDGSKYQIGDISRMDPRGNFWRAFKALTNTGEPVADRAERVAQHMLNMDEGMLTSRVLDIRSNTRSDGFGKVYDPHAPAEVKAKQVGGYLLRPIAPGFMHQAERIRKGLAGEIGPSGQPFDPVIEAMAMVGFRSTPVDTELALEMSFAQSAFALGTSEAAVRKAFTSKGTMRPGKLIETYEWVHQARQAEVEYAHDMLMSSAKVGVSPSVAHKHLYETFRGKSDMIWSGQVTPYFPGDDTIEEIATRTGGHDRVQLLLQLYRDTQARIAAEEN